MKSNQEFNFSKTKKISEKRTNSLDMFNSSRRKNFHNFNMKPNVKSPSSVTYTKLLAFILILSPTLINQFNGSITVVRGQDELNDPKLQRILDISRDWALEFGQDISSGTEETTCMRSLRNKYDPNASDQGMHGYKPTIESINWTGQHKSIVQTINNTMNWHQIAVEAIVKAAEQFAHEHTYSMNATTDYYDVHKIENLEDYDMGTETGSGDGSSAPSDAGQPIEPLPTPDRLIVADESEQQSSPIPESLPPAVTTTTTSLNNVPAKEFMITDKKLKLSKHDNFGDVAINIDESAVHTPVHIYSGDPEIMNNIVWSERLTKTFKNNFIFNPKLTNQFFASQLGFLRLFPAQKWQVKHDDPDLYDARMRPWYAAGASSRKDVIILVDASGSMTGSRRDIARGVVLEILDTLTDNDRFVVLKFSDSIQQVGVPVCPKLSPKASVRDLPKPNEVTTRPASPTLNGSSAGVDPSANNNNNDTIDVNNFYFLPANKRNVRHVKTNFNIATSGIANFSRALVTAFDVLENYRKAEDPERLCNQAIMLITDGAPSDFQEIFNKYNYENAPIRMFTYLIGREAGDITHTKMMACRNKGYYTHVINLAEVRESVQQYIPVMARPLVLSRVHPITWTPAYGELTYQILTDWIWESKRREKIRLDAAGSSGITTTTTTNDYPGASEYDVVSDEKLESIDLFGYQKDRKCFWQTHRNDLLTTVVQPVHDMRNETLVYEKFLFKNIWHQQEKWMATAKILGVAAADMKINDIIALAPSYKLGPNAYTIMLTNNGFAMHHPDLRSILEPFDMNDSIEKSMQVLKPFFSTIDLTQVEHVMDSDNNRLIKLRESAVKGVAGPAIELVTKRAIDCQRRPQIRNQSFYYEPTRGFPFSFITAVPQPYGSHHLKAQVELKSLNTPDKISTYLTAPSQYELWTLHPDYKYCEGPSNNSVTNLLDMLHNIETNQLNNIQWKPSGLGRPPQKFQHKLVCDKELVQSLVYDAIATHEFSEKCPIPNQNIRSSLIETYSVRFTFVATRSGLTRVRLFNATDIRLNAELFAFEKFHNRAIDETFYSRTVDYNMLVNASSILIQVPFNTHLKIKDQLIAHELALNESRSQATDSSTDNSSSEQTSDAPGERQLYRRSLDYDNDVTSNTETTTNVFEQLDILANKSIHAIATQAIIANEGPQKAVAGVAGVFYDYASFATRFFKSINRRMDSSSGVWSTDRSGQQQQQQQFNAKTGFFCGNLNDSVDCLLLDNNGYIIVSEDLEMIGRSVGDYSAFVLQELLKLGIYREIEITDYQAVCMRYDKAATTSKTPVSSSASSLGIDMSGRVGAVRALLHNFMASLATLWTVGSTLITNDGYSPISQAYALEQQMPNNVNNQKYPKTYLRPCEQKMKLYEANQDILKKQSDIGKAYHKYTNVCGPNCNAWFAFEPVPLTNLIMLTIDWGHSCKLRCPENGGSALGSGNELIMDDSGQVPDQTITDQQNEEQVCKMFEREHSLFKKNSDSCTKYHKDESKILLCGGAGQITPGTMLVIIGAMLAILLLKINNDI